MDDTLSNLFRTLCRGLTFQLYRQQKQSVDADGLALYACCVKRPAHDQNMHVIMATAMWPSSDPPPEVVPFDSSALVWLDVQLQNVRSTESEWPDLLRILCPERDETHKSISERNLQWELPNLDGLAVRRVTTVVLPAYVTFECYDRRGGPPLAHVLILNKHVTNNTPLMLRSTTGLESDGSLSAALKEWCTRIVPLNE